MKLHRQRAFTLVEMLVALAVSALLVGLAYAALRTGMRSWEVTGERVERVDNMRIGWQFLHRTLSGARQLGDPLSNNGESLFKGEPDKLTFAADMASHLGLGGLYVIELFADPQENGKRLLLRRTLLSEYRQANTQNHPQQAVLVDNLQQLKISYYGSQDGNTAAIWQRQWHALDGLPTLIRIDVTEADGSHWPSLLSYPRLGQRNTIEQAELFAPADLAGQTQ